MTDRVADTSLRLLAPRARAEGTGDSDSLQNVNTFELPNGSLCWVNSTEGLYRLDKLSTDAPVVGVVIIPIAGPGRWILLSSGAVLEQFSAAINLAAGDLVTPNLSITPAAAAQWTAGPVGLNIYLAEVTPIFTADLDAGTLTYNGPSRIYRLETYAVLNVPIFSGSGLIAITADKLSAATALNDRIGTLNTDGTEAMETNLGTDVFQSLAASRTTLLNAGDVVRPALTDTDLGLEPLPFEMIVRRLQLVATPFA